MSHLYCPECGFQNPEAATYCSKCGSLLPKEAEGSETTMSFAVEDATDEGAFPIEDVERPALVIRSGGGRSGEHFTPSGDQTTIGRSPDCDIFLDDVTVSRRHAVLVRRGDRFVIEDLGSLNGTFLNRRRIESAELEDGDEVQVGKYRLIFLGH